MERAETFFGKGYRAICLFGFYDGFASAYHLKRKAGHTSLFNAMILHLQLLRAGICGLKDSDEEIPPEIINQFFEGIANLDYLQRIQVIVLDNREPPNSVKARINHIFFSKTHEPSSRYGFFPT